MWQNSTWSTPGTRVSKTQVMWRGHLGLTWLVHVEKLETESLRLDFNLGFFKINTSHTERTLSTLTHPLSLTQQTLTLTLSLTLSLSHWTSASLTHSPSPLSLTLSLTQQTLTLTLSLTLSLSHWTSASLTHSPSPLLLTHPLLSLTALSLSLHSLSPLFQIHRLRQKIR